MLQTGYVRNYGAGFAAGLLVVAIWLVVRGCRDREAACSRG